MPSFNLFKKTPSKGSSANSLKGDLTGPPALQKNRVDAATEVMGMFDRYFKSAQESYPGTVLSTAAWLTGTSLYRSFGYAKESEPGTMVLSAQADQELPELLKLFQVNIAKHKIKLGSAQLARDIPENQNQRKPSSKSKKPSRMNTMPS